MKRYLLVLAASLYIVPFPGGAARLSGQTVHTSASGFIRSGLYEGLHKETGGLPFASVFADGGIRVDVRSELNFRAYADLRYRYGSEFGETVSDFTLREGWISVYSQKLELALGQRIIKWGRADFDNPVSSLNPRNLIVRSPEKEDADMGNISASLVWKPLTFLSLQAVVSPFYRPDVLITKAIGLSEGTTIHEIEGLTGGKSMTGYGFRADFYTRGADFAFSYFNGNDPLPGIAFTSADVNIDEGVAEISTELSITPYRISRAGIDFEAAAGRFGLRGEASLTIPELSFREYMHIPMPEIKWAAGADVSIGSVIIGAEYIGKYITDFEPSAVEPLLPGETPPLSPEQIGSIPGGLDGYIVMQTAAFNRLYMYQLKDQYHSVGFRIETDFGYGRLTPSLFGLYNFTTGDLALVPSLKFKPADGLMLIGGADIYKGRKGSLYDIIDKPLSSLFIAVRVDFQ